MMYTHENKAKDSRNFTSVASKLIKILFRPRSRRGDGSPHSTSAQAEAKRELL